MASSPFLKLKREIGPIGTQLRGLTPEQQEEHLKEERRAVSSSLMGIMGGRSIPALNWAQYVRPPAQKKMPTSTSRIAERDLSEKRAYDAIKEMGEQLRRTSAMEEVKAKVNKTIRNAYDAEIVAETIVSFCSQLPAYPTGSDTVIDKNDIRRVLLGVVRILVNATREAGDLEIVKEFVIYHPNHYSYLHLQFSSTASIHDGWCSWSKTIDMTITKSFFNVHEDRVDDL